MEKVDFLKGAFISDGNRNPVGRMLVLKRLADGKSQRELDGYASVANCWGETYIGGLARLECGTRDAIEPYTKIAFVWKSEDVQEVTARTTKLARYIGVSNDELLK